MGKYDEKRHLRDFSSKIFISIRRFQVIDKLEDFFLRLVHSSNIFQSLKKRKDPINELSDLATIIENKTINDKHIKISFPLFLSPDIIFSISFKNGYFCFDAVTLQRTKNDCTPRVAETWLYWPQCHLQTDYLRRIYHCFWIPQTFHDKRTNTKEFQIQ